MPVTVDLRQADGLALVTIDNTPVNAIGYAERAGLLAAANQLAITPGIERVVLTGRGRLFAAGADAKEFDRNPVEPHLPDVIAAIERSPVPWIAAINGAALGGGAEIVLGCRYRIAAPTARIGFPEVNLGIVPGAGGTQRLPRLIGMSTALSMVSLGKPMKAAQALAAGLIDAEAENTVLAASELDLSTVPKRIALSQVAQVDADESAVEKTRSLIARRMRLQAAPEEAVNLIASTSSLEFKVGMARERATFLQLRASEQARALRHVFFAERGAKAPPSIAAAKSPVVTEAIVVGGGNMGASIAYALALAGITTTIVETSVENSERAQLNVHGLIDAAKKRGLLTEEAEAATRQRIHMAQGYDQLPEAQLAIEAVFEDMAVKQQVFNALAAVLPPTAVLASNTSYLDVNEIAQSVASPERVIGMHFFSPAHIMKLLEIVRGDASNDAALATAFSVAGKLQKVPVLAGVCDGFIGNRILARYREAADALLMDGSIPWEIDKAMVDFGYAMGPYEAQDLSGLDIAHANRRRQAPSRDSARRYIPISDRMVSEGRLGCKTGLGWYRYADGDGKLVDPSVEKLITEEARLAKVLRRKITTEEIQQRLLMAMINEALYLLDEGIAQTPADVDLVLIHGYGFPRWRGGLLYYAEAIGWRSVLQQLESFAEEDAVVWQPSPMLYRLCANSVSLYSENSA